MKHLKILTTSILLLSIFVFQATVIAEISVIVNPNNSSSLSQKEIKRIFLGKMKKYPDGKSIIAINLSSGDANRSHFEKTVVGKSVTKMKAFWAKQVFSGKGNPPKEVTSDSEAINLVAENPAVIGYVESSKVTDKVKVIGKY